MGTYKHIPVLWKEVLEYVQSASCSPSGTFVDCTLGEGGHSEIFLREFPNAKVIAFERDENILAVAKERLASFGGRIKFINDNFANIDKYLNKEDISFMLYDFGISSYHYESNRGFSFAFEENLDMKLDDMGDVNACDVVNTFNEKQLADIIYTLGEERFSRRIARRIVEKRKETPIETTTELAEIVLRAIPKKFHVKNIHPATRVFQALRIYVNDELNAIRKSLKLSYEYIKQGGLILAISFHSLEDRLVKQHFRNLSKGCLCNEEPCNCMYNPFVKLITKKPVTPQEEELSTNNRARSAKLRVCEKL